MAALVSRPFVEGQSYTGYQVSTSDEYGKMSLYYTKNQFRNMYTLELDSYEQWYDQSEIRLSLEFIANYGVATKRMIFYCSPKLGYCTDVRLTKDVYEMTVSDKANTYAYLTSRPKDDPDLDDNVDGVFNLTIGRNVVDPKTQSVILDFTFSGKATTLKQDSVVMKWGVFAFPEDEDIFITRGSNSPVTYFNKMSFSDVYSDRRLLFVLNTLNWVLSLGWVFGLPFMSIVSIIQAGYLIFKLLECIALLQDSYTDFEQQELFSTANFVSGPIFRWTVFNGVISFLMLVFSLIPGIGFMFNTYLWSMSNMLNYTIY